MCADGFGKYGGDGHARVERAVGVLEDDLHFFSQAAHGFAVEFGDGLAFVVDRAVGGFYESKDGATGGCFSAAGFADEAKRFSAGNIESDSVYGANVSGDA